MSNLRLSLAAIVIACLQPTLAVAQAPRRPNVILVIADDMGHGDLGFHKNPIIKTPHLDRLAKQSVRMKHFYVSPVCAPTRASLLTGRYNYRTGVVDTYLGRALMHSAEVTLAEILAAAGYRTGIFGKWHLGDNYPLRAIDQGFQETLVLKGGGIGQPSDPPGGESYFDPVLQHNGKQVKTKGYCSDVFTDAALDFIAGNRERPFFCYVAYNAPHGPLQVPDHYHQMYAKLNLAHAQFPMFGQPLPGKADQDATAKVYGMVSNIDDNVGRLLAKLEELKLAENTIVIFLTDNGPQQVRYNSGMRGRKGSVWEGGVRVPCFIRWPAKLPADRDVNPIAAHIDVVPTLAAACGASLPENVKMDGINLLPIMKSTFVGWPDRTLYCQWHRGDIPEMGRACAARAQKWRLVQPEGAGDKPAPANAKFLLFDMDNDPYEMHDLAERHPDIVAKMKADYEAWFRDVSGTRGFDPPRIHLGSNKEPVSVLTRQDWRGAKAGWGPNSVGHWEVHTEQGGDFLLKITAPRSVKMGTVRVRVGDREISGPLVGGLATISATIPQGPQRLETWIETSDGERGALFVEARRRVP